MECPHFSQEGVLDCGKRTQNHIICLKVIACESIITHAIEERMERKTSGIVELTALKTEVSTRNHPNMVMYILRY